MNSSAIEELRSVFAMKSLSDDDLEWLASVSEARDFRDGEVLAKTGELIESMWMLTSGKINFYMDVHGKLVFYFTFANDEKTGGVTGLLPYSRMKLMLGCSYAEGEVRGYQLHKDHFAELERRSPETIQRLIGYMTERARSFATIQLQHEKVNALGQLAAGIAHELNNPASAISRIGDELQNRLKTNYRLTEKLLYHQMSPLHIQTIRAMVQIKEDQRESRAKMTAMKRMQAEDDIIEWLGAHGVTDLSDSVDAFVDNGFEIADLEEILRSVGEASFKNVVHWLENLLSSERLMNDLTDASGRISHLVGAIKSHVHMDRTNERQLSQINTDLENTLILLAHKIRDKNISLHKEFDEQLPMVSAYVGELNQVWTNLIDNAIYAMDKGGELRVRTRFDERNISVDIIDNGSGIPADIQSRVFDPFFTTKKVGEGTGIGLDLVNRIVKNHQGDIKMESRPGFTRFTICVPRDSQS